jgi:putative DNA primase/helicase
VSPPLTDGTPTSAEVLEAYYNKKGGPILTAEEAMHLPSARFVVHQGGGGERKPAATTPSADADQYTIAQALIARMEAASGTRPVYTLGQFWTVSDALWVPQDIDKVAATAGDWFGGLKYCRRGSDFRNVAWLASQIVGDDRFFENGAIGVAGPLNFWRIDVDGTLRNEPLRPEHRVRTRVSAEPDFSAEAPRFDSLLASAFGMDECGQKQRSLLQRLSGAAISRQLWRRRIAVLLLGPTTTGKTQFLTILKNLFPADQVGATSPQRWDSEYYRAALAGKVLNIVGELDPNQPIPGGAFKSVVGQDVIEGRHPTHRPFSFVCQAAHFFNSNKLPPTIDRSDAFFRRWRIVHFKNQVTEETIVPDFGDLIFAEEIGPVVAWMLDGAVMVATEKGIPTTPEHDILVRKWRNANNSALQFLCDPRECVLEADATIDGKLLFERYQTWARESGVKAFGRNGFYEALEEGAGRLGVCRFEEHRYTMFRGVRTA